MEDIRTIRTQLLQYQAENQKLKTQLHCLISLVRKAWTGDHSAAIDVAKIVGVSPPTLEISPVTDKLVTVPKPPVVNNWLKLTIGLINKKYKEHKMTIKENQLTYLKNQEAYIDEQIGKKALPKEETFKELKLRTNSLHKIVEKEDKKRNMLRKELEKGTILENRIVSQRETNNSQRKIAFSEKNAMKTSDDMRIGDCLMIHARNQHQVVKESPPKTSKARPQSAGCFMNKKSDHRNPMITKRPESAKVSSTVRQKKSPGKGAGRRRSGENRRISQELGETEKDIVMTLGLLQKRLGVDNAGMI